MYHSEKSIRSKIFVDIGLVFVLLIFSEQLSLPLIRRERDQCCENWCKVMNVNQLVATSGEFCLQQNSSV